MPALLLPSALALCLLGLIQAAAVYAKTPAVTEDPAPAPIKNPPPRRETVRNRMLADEMATREGIVGEPVWIGEGLEPFLGVHMAANAQHPRGVLLVMHDDGHHPDWPGLVRHLRTTLPDEGWATFSLAIPDYVPNARDVGSASPTPTVPAGAPAKDVPSKAATPDKPPRPVAGKNPVAGEALPNWPPKNAVPPDEAVVTDASADVAPTAKTPAKQASRADASADTPPAGMDPRVAGMPFRPLPSPDASGRFLQRDVEVPPVYMDDVLHERIRLALDHLKVPPDTPIAMVAIGQTAGLLAGVLASRHEPTPATVVLVDARPFPAPNFDLVKDAVALDVPVLDIVTREDQVAQADVRRKAARREGREDYRQRQLTGQTEEVASGLTKAVAGWVSASAPRAKTSVAAQPSVTTPTAITPATAPTSTPPASEAAPSTSALPVPPPPAASGMRTVPPRLTDPVPPPIP